MRKLISMEVQTLDERHLAAVRHVGPFQGDVQLFDSLYHKLMVWAEPRGVLNEPDTQFINIYYDNPEECAPEKLRLDVCVTVPEEISPEGEVQHRILQGGDYAVARFELNPEDYSEAWGEAVTWVMQNGYEMDNRPCFEICHNDPDSNPENRHIVDIVISVRK